MGRGSRAKNVQSRDYLRYSFPGGDLMVEDKLPIGRIAFARSACIDWVSEHSKSVLISLASALVLLFALFQIVGKFSEGHRSDFVEAQSAYSDWIAAKISDDQLFKKLEKPLNRSPELQAQIWSPCRPAFSDDQRSQKS